MMMNDWDRLGIEPTSNTREIKKAYAAKSKTVHPEEKPEEFKQLYTAYKNCLLFAERMSAPSTNTEEVFSTSQSSNNKEKQDEHARSKVINFNVPKNTNANSENSPPQKDKIKFIFPQKPNGKPLTHIEKQSHPPKIKFNIPVKPFSTTNHTNTSENPKKIVFAHPQKSAYKPSFTYKKEKEKLVDFKTLDDKIENSPSDKTQSALITLEKLRTLHANTKKRKNIANWKEIFNSPEFKENQSNTFFTDSALRFFFQNRKEFNKNVWIYCVVPLMVEWKNEWVSSPFEEIFNIIISYTPTKERKFPWVFIACIVVFLVFGNLFGKSKQNELPQPTSQQVIMQQQIQKSNSRLVAEIASKKVISNVIGLTNEDIEALLDEQNRVNSVTNAIAQGYPYTMVEDFATSIGLTQESYNQAFIEYQTNNLLPTLWSFMDNYHPFEVQLISEKLLPTIRQSVLTDSLTIESCYCLYVLTSSQNTISGPTAEIPTSSTPSTTENVNSIQSTFIDLCVIYRTEGEEALDEALAQYTEFVFPINLLSSYAVPIA